MDDLARGWAIVMGHTHGHSSAFWIAVFVAVWLPIIMGALAARKRTDHDADDNYMRSKPRTRIAGTETRIPGSEKDCRR